MRAILVTCPHCGARVEVRGDSPEVRCAYCDTVARVQRRTRVLARPAPVPTADRGLPVAVERRGAALTVILVLVLATGGLMGGVMFALRRPPAGSVAPRAERPTPAPTPPRPSWQGTYPPILVDVTGDGVRDLVGRSRLVVPEDVSRVIAIDGATGKLRWQGPSLGTYIDSYQGVVAVAGDLVLFASPRGEVRALAAATGAQRWAVRLDERTERFCDGGDAVIAVGVDGVARPLRRADGSAAPAAEPAAPPARPARRASKPTRPACTAVPSDHDRRGAWSADWSLGDRHGMGSPVLAAGPAGRVLGGTRRTGSQVPMLAALDGKTGTRWKILVPEDPLAASQRPPEHVVVGDDSVCASYATEGAQGAAHLACFAMADGRRLWDRVVGASMPSSVQRGDGGLVVVGAKVEVLDLATGAVRWTY